VFGYLRGLIKRFVREWGPSLIIAFAIAMVIRTFVIQAFKIPTGSMRMTLVEGDRIFVSKFRYGAKVPFTKVRLPGFGKPQRGDVVVFIYPEDTKRDFIKRLIAFDGETVEIRDGDIYINGKEVMDPPIKNLYYYNRGEYGQAGKKVKVPKGYYFVLGDNSASSKDGRYWGFFPEDFLIGKAEVIYWPLNRIRFVQ